jgi:hypothetical protein
MSDDLTEVRFWAQVMGDAKRTVICNPDLESRVKGWIDARGMGGLITVQATPVCPIDRTYIVDDAALQAAYNEVMQRPIKIDYWRSS